MKFTRSTAVILFVFFAAGAVRAAGDRIRKPVDSSHWTVIQGNRHPLAQPRFDRGPADPATPMPYVTLLLRPDPSLQEFLAGQRRPGSPHYGKRLSPQDFADRFGLSAGDIAKVRAWLESQGLRVNDVARGRNWITFSGTTAQLAKALHTEFHRYRAEDGGSHVANAFEPSVPEALAGVVAGFRGLNDFRPRPPARTLAPAAAAPQYNSGGYHYLAPGDLAKIYDLTPLYNAGFTGAGQTIVVVGESDPSLSDVAAFRARFALPINNPTPVLFGPDPGLDLGALAETDLDLEWAGAVAPGANVTYAYAYDAYLALQYAVDQNLGQVISLSYGSCELEQSSAFEAVAQQANAEGITLVAASGDSGAANCDRYNPTPQVSSGASVSWPASFPEVTAVGGSELNEGGGSYWSAHTDATGNSAISYIPELPWNDSTLLNALMAAGGGPSRLFPKPAWQTGLGVPADGARDLPDVSLTASWAHDPYLMEYQGRLVTNGGTSASAQAFAGMVALLNQYLVANGTLSSPGLGNINPALYRMAQAGSPAFHDIISGDTRLPCAQGTLDCVNGLIGYAATAGYDMATGLGSVDLNLLATTWNSGPPSTTTLTANPARSTPDATVQLTALVKSTAGGTPTGSVAFTLEGVMGLSTAYVVPGAPAGELALGSAPLDGNGSAAIGVAASLLSVGSGTVRAGYSGDGVFNGSAGAANVTVDYPASANSVVVPAITPNPVMGDGYQAWPYVAALVERGGVGTTLTKFTVDGVNQNLASWTSTSLPANGAIYASLAGHVLTTPLNRTFVFSGQDASGQNWTRQVSVPFLPASGVTRIPEISLTTATPVVPQNPQAAANCQWTQQISVQELGGFLMMLGPMTVNGASTPVQNVFGATRLAPFGLLTGSLCLSSPGTAATQMIAVSDSGNYYGGATAQVSASTAAAPDSPASFSSPAPGDVVTLNADASGAVSPTVIPVAFANGAPAAWTVTVSPANQAARWLTVSPLSGTGAGAITVSASAAGLSPGAYTARLSIASLSAQPQVVEAVVTLVIGASPSVSIAGLVNNFSGGLTAAPGMLVAVFGTGMAPAGTALSAPGLPLPLSLAGVSATVNGVSAPLYYVSPGQINVQIPYETGAGTAVLAVNNNGQIATSAFTVAITAPGLYPAAFSNSTGRAVTTAAAGDALVLYLTGEGDLTPTLATGATPAPSANPLNYPQPRQPVTVTVGGVPAKLLFQAVPYGLAGVTQIDFLVPSGAASGTQQVLVTVGGEAAPPLTLTIAAGPM